MPAGGIGNGLGYLISFPNNYLPNGLHAINICFDNSAGTFNGTLHMLDYINDNNFNYQQKGVTMPSELAMIFPANKGLPSSTFIVFSGEK